MNLDQWFRRWCLLKIFLIWSSGSPFVQQMGTISAIFEEGIMRNNSVKYFEFEPVVQEMFKDISYLELWWPFCSAEHNHLCNFGKGIMRNNSVNLFRIWASGSGDVIKNISYLELWQPSCSVERNHLCIFERRHHREHSFEVILNLDEWFRRRWRLKKKFTEDGCKPDERVITIPHLELQLRCASIRLSVCPSVMLSLPKPLEEIQPNLVCVLLTWMGCATAVFFRPAPWGPGEGPKGQILLNTSNFNYVVNFKDF